MVDSGERAVELGDYLGILRRRWLGVLIIALTTLALASAVTLAMPKKYTATTRLFIAVAGEISDRSGAGIELRREADVVVCRGGNVATGLGTGDTAARSANHSKGAGGVGGGHRASGHSDS